MLLPLFLILDNIIINYISPSILKSIIDSTSYYYSDSSTNSSQANLGICNKILKFINNIFKVKIKIGYEPLQSLPTTPTPKSSIQD